MSGYGNAPPLTEPLGYCPRCGRDIPAFFCDHCGIDWEQRRNVVRDVAFVLRLQGHIHHNTARRLALALKREGLLYDGS